MEGMARKAEGVQYLSVPTPEYLVQYQLRHLTDEGRALLEMKVETPGEVLLKLRPGIRMNQGCV